LIILFTEYICEKVAQNRGNVKLNVENM
jgi:hypothetical protein